MSGFQRTLSQLTSKNDKGSVNDRKVLQSFNLHDNTHSVNVSQPSTPKNHSGGSKSEQTSKLINKMKQTLKPTEEGDRFICPRDPQQLEYAQAVMSGYYVSGTTHEVPHEYECAIANAIGKPLPPTKITTSENINGTIVSQQQIVTNSSMKILSYHKKPMQPVAVSSLNSNNPLSRNLNSMYFSSARHIRQHAEKVLDAPLVKNDFYLNLLSWSDANVLAVSLDDSVYLWNATSLSIANLLTCNALDSDEEVINTGDEAIYVSSVRWCPGGSAETATFLAVGLSNGTVQLWDSEEKVAVRTMPLSSPSSILRVPCLAWMDHLLFTASRSGWIHVHDVRIAHHEVRAWQAHTQEICGIEINSNGQYLASGGNDNLVHIWSLRESMAASTSNIQPRFSISEHRAAVKALAWCPWRPTLLATGAGTADPHLRLFNASPSSSSESSNSTTMISSIKDVTTDGQISGVVWNEHHREILTSHGEPGQLSIWKYPKLENITNLKGHEGRILSIAASPGGENIATIASDETLQIWACFKVEPHIKKIQEEERLEAKHRSTISNSFNTLR